MLTLIPCAAGIPVEAAKKSSHVAIVVTSRGGHIGFMEGVIPTNTYYSDRLYKQLVSGVFSNLDHMQDVQAEAMKNAKSAMGVPADEEQHEAPKVPATASPLS